MSMDGLGGRSPGGLGQWRGGVHSPPQRLGISDKVSGQRAWREATCELIILGQTIKCLCGGE